MNEEKLDSVEAFVEATSFEQYMLWHENKYKELTTNGYLKPRKWVNDNAGFMKTIGFVNEKPVSVSFNFASIDDKKVCFYVATSKIVDWDMVEKWLKDNYPSIQKIDAQNMGDIF